MTRLEAAILELLLAGDDPILAALQKQLHATRVSHREKTGVGFFAHLDVPEEVARLVSPSDFVMDDVAAELESTSHAARFLLSVRDGALDFLEGVMLGETWPQDPTLRRAYYLRREPGGDVVVETGKRDLDGLRRLWSG